MSGIPGRPGNVSPGMHTLLTNSARQACVIAWMTTAEHTCMVLGAPDVNPQLRKLRGTTHIVRPGPSVPTATLHTAEVTHQEELAAELGVGSGLGIG